MDEVVGCPRRVFLRVNWERYRIVFVGFVALYNYVTGYLFRFPDKSSGPLVFPGGYQIGIVAHFVRGGYVSGVTG